MKYESKALIRSVGFKTDACKNEILWICNQGIKNPQDFVFASVGFKTDGSDQGTRDVSSQEHGTAANRPRSKREVSHVLRENVQP